MMDPNSIETRPGFKTSEFWASVASSVALWASHASQAGQLPLKWTAIIQAAITVGYGIARGLAKLAVPNNPPTNPPA